MNIQKSRITAILSVAIIACMMVTVMAVPAFAAEVEEQAYYVDVECTQEQMATVHDYFCNWCAGYEPSEETFSCYMTENGEMVVSNQEVRSRLSSCSINWDSYTTYPINGEYYVITPLFGTVVAEDRDSILTFTRVIPDETEPDETEPDVTSPAVPPSDSDTSDSELADLVTSETLSLVIDEIVGLLPTIVPVIVVFIGLRKGIAFVQNVLHNG